MKTFLQTKEWIDFQEHIGRKVWRFDNGKISAGIISHELPLGKNYLYIPHGPALRLENFESGIRNEVDGFLAYLKDVAKKEKSIFIKFEPLSDAVMELIFRKGMKKRADSIQPHKTIIIDLGLSEEQLLSEMHHKTRYNINLSSRKNLEFREGEDVSVFWKLLKKTAEKDKFQTHDKNYYFNLFEYFKNGDKLRVKLFLINHDNKAIAGALVLFHEDTAYYIHGAMDRDYKELMAPYLLHWEIIRRAKSLGYGRYDFWGLDARRWPGVTRFKLGWLGSTKPTGEGGGGRQIEHPGSFDMPVSRFWYLMYKIGRKIF